MPTISLIYFLSLINLSFVRAVGQPTPEAVCVYGCYDFTDHITWDLSPALAKLNSESDHYYEVLCRSELKYKSIFHCSQFYCTHHEISAGLNFLNATCEQYARVTLPSFDSIALPALQLAKVERVSMAAEASSVNNPVDHPVIPDRHWIRLLQRTVSTYYENIWLSYDFSYACFGFWGLVLLAGMVYRATDLYTSPRGRPQYDRTQQLPLISRIWLWIRSRLLLPATFGKHCQAPLLGGTIPPRVETLVIVTYIIMNFVFCFPGYDLFLGNQYWPSKNVQLSRYVSDRTGQLALANIPIIWMFAARNNPFIWLTGWSFASFSRFHRWVARVAFIEAFVHSVGYSVNTYQDGGYYTEEWKYTYWYCGAIATIVMAFIVASSAYWLRASHYDLFLVLHIVLAIIFLVTLWDHLHIFTGLYNPWMWPMVAIWVWDRALRYGRILYVSVVPRVSKGVKAVVTYNKSSEVLRLDVTKFFQGKPPEPGLFYFVYTPKALRGWESHPFTVCSWAPGYVDSDVESRSSAIEGEKKADVRVTSNFRSPSLTTNVNHSFLIRPYGGFTQRLRNAVDSKTDLESGDAEGAREETVFLEGPYGTNLDLRKHSNVLVIAGGSGITAAISHSYHLLAHDTTTVQISWAVPQRQLVDDICQHELAVVIKHPRLRMDVHITSSPDHKDDDSVLYGHRVSCGRPDVYEIMRDARAACERDLAIVTCGTPTMADACRAAVVRLLKKPGPNVSYYNESMMW